MKDSNETNLSVLPDKIEINLNNNAKWAVIIIGLVIILFSLFRLIKALKKG